MPKHLDSSVVRDVALAGRGAIRVGRAEFRERRRRRGESAEFREAFRSARAVHGWLARREAEVLWAAAQLGGPDRTVVEIGSHLGRSTIVLADGASRAGAHVHAVDPHTGDRSLVEDLGLKGIDTSRKFEANLEAAGVREHVSPLVMTSLEAAASWDNGRTVAVMFIDGWHSVEAVIEDVESWAEHRTGDSVLLFDDADHPDVAEALRRLEASDRLPPRAGDVGKVRVHGPSEQIARIPRLRSLCR